MNALTLTVLMAVGPVGAHPSYQQPAPATYQTLPITVSADPPAPPANPEPAAAPAPANPALCDLCTAPVRRLFQSDHEFDGFVGPVSNPVFSKDPRSNSYARFLFINNNIPASHPLGGGNIQVYALQTNLAVTERLSIIAEKDGLAHFATRNAPSQTGFLNLAAGLKYTFYRNVETQTLAAAGFLYEIPSGEAKVLQNHGAGSFAPFVSFGQEFAQKWHYLQTTGYYFPVNNAQGSSFLYNSFHVDRQVLGWLYPLAELNWFWYTSGGKRLPTAIGEGDGLLNLGTRGQAGAHLVTAAFGAKAVLSKNYSIGAVFEVPLSNRHDVLNQRLTVELIARY
ncbi:hypothetical protein VT84_27415 [Gemmata sp. SH-PL17]|uniref:hypothetical protein n=1 Tax=Gemmata sp. SH-PL17 TaxID=1630693 RepID=UPI00078C4980|nr:hypothetical protein [Gemmata sp. SH-PL17]AMV28166.1 hypothetical protein VT84_27415 [Gemmata sp. SH-PL17]